MASGEAHARQTAALWQAETIWRLMRELVAEIPSEQVGDEVRRLLASHAAGYVNLSDEWVVFRIRSLIEGR